jgi:DNA-binding transcriptional LysR family regulator
LADQGLKRHIKVRTRNPGLGATVVKNTDLAMTVPERFAGYYSLKALPLPFPVPPLAWRLYWPVRSELDPGNIWLRKLITDIAEQYQQGELQTL